MLMLAGNHNLCYDRESCPWVRSIQLCQLLNPDTVFKQEIYAYKAQAYSSSS